MSIYFKITKKLDHFTVNVEYGFEKGTLVIQGESGAGKTTILNCISGLKSPDEGEIRIHDRVLFDQKTCVKVKDRHIGYLFQNYALFPNMNIQNNVLYGIKNKQEYRNRAQRKELVEYAEYIMEVFGILHLKKKFPAHISGGEKQRAALARAIVTKPELLLLDEPFSALDSATKEYIYDEFFRFKEKFGIPTILITHDPRESQMFADQKIMMKKGEVNYE